MKRLAILVLILAGITYVVHCSAEGYIPFGPGHIVHVCGDIVDEDLKPIREQIKMRVNVTRPLTTIKGNSKIDEYIKTIKGPGFCLNYAYAWYVTAYIESDRIEAPTISIGRGMVKYGFQWVVEKKDSIIEGQDLKPCRFIYSPSDTNRSYSSAHPCYRWVKSNAPSWGLEENDSDIRLLTKMSGLYDSSKSNAELLRIWMEKYPGSISPVNGNDYVKYNLNNPEYIADIVFENHDGRLILLPGPLVKTQFAPATIDSPACNLTRMANPPPLGSPAWKDSLVIAQGDSVLMDGFYAYFPWNNNWTKVLLDTVVTRKNDRVSVGYFLMQEKVSDRPTFPNKIDGYDAFFLRKKCLTKAEKMWAGEHNTTFRTE